MTITLANEGKTSLGAFQQGISVPMHPSGNIYEVEKVEINFDTNISLDHLPRPKLIYFSGREP